MQEIDAREFAEWRELYKQEPFGDDWEQAAKIMATFVNVWQKRPLDYRRFMPPSTNTKTRRTPQQLEAEMMHWGRMHNKSAETRATKKKGRAACRQSEV